jgi:hypothetical protein
MLCCLCAGSHKLVALFLYFVALFNESVDFLQHSFVGVLPVSARLVGYASFNCAKVSYG